MEYFSLNGNVEHLPLSVYVYANEYIPLGFFTGCVVIELG